MNFGEKLKKYRKNAKMTQHALSIHLGVSHSTINRWEKSTTTPSFSMLEKLANVLNVPSSYIVGDGNTHPISPSSNLDTPPISPIQDTDCVAFQGFMGAYSHCACLKIYGKDTHIHPCKTFKHVFEAVEQGTAHHAVIPIENSLGGRVADIHHLLPEFNLHIIGEYYLPIQHCLLGIAGATIDDIQNVYSHEQGLAQCRNRLHHMGVNSVPHIDTAGAAHFVSEQKDMKKAALASELAAKIYGLQILENNMQDTNTNITRFIIVSKTPNPDIPHPHHYTHYKTSCLFYTRNIPAALYKALGGFATNAINFSKLESYVPLLNTHNNAFFYLEFDGYPQDPKVINALDELHFYSHHVKILGTYRKNALH